MGEEKGGVKVRIGKCSVCEEEKGIVAECGCRAEFCADPGCNFSPIESGEFDKDGVETVRCYSCQLSHSSSSPFSGDRIGYIYSVCIDG